MLSGNPAPSFSEAVEVFPTRQAVNLWRHPPIPSHFPIHQLLANQRAALRSIHSRNLKTTLKTFRRGNDKLLFLLNDNYDLHNLPSRFLFLVILIGKIEFGKCDSSNFHSIFGKFRSKVNSFEIPTQLSERKLRFSPLIAACFKEDAKLQVNLVS